MPGLAPDPRPPPPRTRPARLHPALQPRAPPPWTRAPAASIASVCATTARPCPAPRSAQRPRPRVLQSCSLSEHRFDTLQACQVRLDGLGRRGDTTLDRPQPIVRNRVRVKWDGRVYE